MMRLLKLILDFYIRSSLHVAICFVALAIVYNNVYELYVPFGYYIFLFCSAIAGYNLIKYGFLWLKKPLGFNITYKLLSLMATVIALAVLIKLEISGYALILLMMITAINLLYVLPIWKGHGLRYSPFFKLFSVSIVWAILIIAIPQFLYYETIPAAHLINDYRLSFLPSHYIELHTLKIFILVIALCIPFEIRDLKYDEEQLKTLPQVLGVQVSKYIGLCLCVLYLLLLYFQNFEIEDIQYSEIIMVTITGAAIWFSGKFKSDYYASFFVEAIPLLWLIIFWAI
ncbi:hypothetical protein JCM19296_1652 [Nonlabens ulvanivorans]|uniref:Prenyltransferase n=1 Tax=Nonlabens ulvanivorans TaxID=906888 RepID=A0A081DAV9_NONUL|nr:hypothetical protein JCM19296_1652 [Nonlabens ulvanivorans]